VSAPPINPQSAAAQWLTRIPSGAFWLLEGALVTLLVVSVVFARREDVTVDAIRVPFGKVDANSGAEAQEERAVDLMHRVHELLWPRLKSLEASGVGSDFWFRSTYSHLMAPTGHCGSFAHVLARTLQRDGFEVKMGQMRVDGAWGGHIVVVASIGDRLVALDPYYDVAFRRKDGRLASLEELGLGWSDFRMQCPSNYNPDFRYEAMRFTNWRGVPVDLLGAFFGRVSLRAHLLNLYWVTVSVAAAGLAVSIPLHIWRRRLAYLSRPADKPISVLFDEVASELRMLSSLYMKSHPQDATLQPTVIVGEAFARLARHRPEEFKDENEFRAVASTVLREVFVERARKRLQQKQRAGGKGAVDPTHRTDVEVAEFQRTSPELFLVLESALKELAARDSRAARTAELRIFGSLPMPAVASILGCSEAASERDWTFAKSFLQRSIRDQGTKS
jgi:RNA polymerase sigma factor (TIGR02999 family)